MSYHQYQIDATVEELAEQFVAAGRDNLQEQIEAYDPETDGDFDSFVENIYDGIVSDLEDMITSEARSITSRMYDMFSDEKNDLVSGCSLESFNCPKCEAGIEVNTDNLVDNILCDTCGDTFPAYPVEVIPEPVKEVGEYLSGCYF